MSSCAVQEDPYIAPTDIQESRVHFEPWSVTPSKGDWVIVFQWRTEELHPFEPMIRYSRYMDRLQGAVRDAGRPPLDESVMYYAMYGSPLDRVNEIWVPVRQEVVKALSGHAEV